MRSLWLWLRRRRDSVGFDDVAIPYAGGTTALGVTMLVVTVVEIVAIELIVPWPQLRAVLAVLAILSVVFLLRALAASVVRPHVLSADSLRIRRGSGVSLTLPLAAVQAVSVRRRDAHRSTSVDGGVGVLALGPETHLDVTLTEPVEVRFGKHHGQVTTLCLTADQPAAAQRAIMDRLVKRV